MNITVAGVGYVGLSLAVLLAGEHNVTAITNIFETSDSDDAPKIKKIIFKGSAPAIYINAFKNMTVRKQIVLRAFAILSLSLHNFWRNWFIFSSLSRY